MIFVYTILVIDYIIALILIYHLSNNDKYLRLLERLKNKDGKYHPIFDDKESFRTILFIILLIPFLTLFLLFLFYFRFSIFK
jgi:hypothetical protein